VKLILIDLRIGNGKLQKEEENMRITELLDVKSICLDAAPATI